MAVLANVASSLVVMDHNLDERRGDDGIRLTNPSLMQCKS
jgi:hypothetical protein